MSIIDVILQLENGSVIKEVEDGLGGYEYDATSTDNLMMMAAVHMRTLLEEGRRVTEPFATAPKDRQIMAWEPYYGWLIVGWDLDHWAIKSSGNGWHEISPNVDLQYWQEMPERPNQDEEEAESAILAINSVLEEQCRHWQNVYLKRHSESSDKSVQIIYLELKLKKALEALQPFAKDCDNVSGYADHWPVAAHLDVTGGDFRRAREAVLELENKE